MKKLFTYGLGAALLAGGLHAQAQERLTSLAYDLGSSQALVQQLESQAAASAARRTPPTVALQVSARQSFTGQVNYREDLGQAGEYVVGEIQGVAGSSFVLRVEGGKVDGNIVFRTSKQAYQYSAGSRGNVLIKKVDIDKVVCVDYNRPAGYREPPITKQAAAGRTAVVSLQSLPGARGCVYLDVDGYYLPAGSRWNNGNAYNAASANMTDANVQAMWELVSEDYRPFSLNVTTDENVFNTYPNNMRMRCVVSPNSGSTIAPNAGGVAYVTSFNYNDETVCWVFMSDPKSGGEAASHEVGHTLGLSHDGRNNPAEGYYTGQDNSGAWAPIMGAGYYKPVTHWSRGEYNRANNQEDDLAIMASATYNVGYRADDHSGSTSGATNLARSGNNLTGSGIIERTSDQDYFTFSTSGGTASFNVNTVGRYGNLDIVARLFNSGGTLLGTYDTAGGGNLNVSFSASLGAGTYYLQIDGTSSGNPATDGYSDYASLGTFSIAGSAPAPASSGVATFYKDCNYGGTAVALPVGDYTLSALQARGIANDDISSLTINSGYQVILYEDDNYAGNGVILTASNSCLVNVAVAGGNWNDRTTSLRVQTASSTAFSRQLEAEAANVNNGMTVETCSEGGQDMGYIDPGDYLVWNSINIPTTGTYLIEYRVASPNGGTISSDLNAGSIQLGNTSFGATGGYQSWATASKTVKINAGTYNFGIYAQTGGYNLNWVRITRQGSARPAAATASPATDAAALELYPNPVVDRLELHAAQPLAGAQYRILNTYGQPVAAGTAAERVDVSALPAGSYVLHLTLANGQQVTRRFAK